MGASEWKIPLITEASGPATAPARLRELAGYRGGIREAVAANPNTPTDILLWVARDCFETVLRNPVLPLLILENPGLPAEFPLSALRGLLRDSEPPQEFLQPLLRHPDLEIREAARLHVANRSAPAAAETAPELEIKGGAAVAELISLGAAPPWLLRRALECSDGKVRARALVEICKGPDKELRARVTLLRDAGASGWLNSIGRGKDLDPALLASLAEGGPFARNVAARHPRTPSEILERLAAPGELDSIRRTVARNPSTPAATLLNFALTGDLAMRKAVLRNRATPAAVLDQLASAPEVQIRLAVAGNPATPVAALSRLAVDSDTAVRERVASNAASDRAALDRLVTDKDESVRRALAKRRNCPVELLRKLAVDEDDLIQLCAIENRNFPGDLQMNLDRHFQETTPEGTTKGNVADPPSAEELEALQIIDLARDRSTSSEVLADLAKSSKKEVRAAVAWNKSTPSATLLDLASDPEASVRQRVACHECPPAAALVTLASDSAIAIRFAAAQNANLPLLQMESLSHDHEPSVRARLVYNRSAPVELTDRMAREDTDPDVREGFANPYNSQLADDTIIWLARNVEGFAAKLHNPRPVPELLEVIVEKLQKFREPMFLFSNGYQHRRTGVDNAIPPHLLLKMAHPADDQYGYWRHKMMKEIAQYWAVTPEVLESFAEELLGDLRRWRSINGSIVTALAAIARNKKTPSHVLLKLVAHQMPRVRLAALDNPSTPATAKEARLGPTLAEALDSAAPPAA